jgi:hypothetical protein
LKLKLSKTSWLILLAGLFIVIIAGLGLTRSQQLQEQSRLNEELSQAEVRLSKLEVQQLGQQKEELQGQLDEKSVQLVAAKDRLRQSVESINVTDKFFAIAKSCDVIVDSITSSSIRSEKLVGISCSVINLGATVTGDTSHLINFVIKLNTDFTTGLVKSAQISIPEADQATVEGKAPSANIQMVVYAYEGD